MNRKAVKGLITLFENFDEVFETDNLYVATYIYFRYGLTTFNKEINNSKLQRIDDEIQKNGTMFDKDLNYRIDKILNSEN